MVDCSLITNILSSLSSIFAVLLLVSELLPYASSSKCNSIMEGVGHVFCRTSCFVSNKNIRFDNEDLRHKNRELNEDNDELKKEVEYLKKTVLNEIAYEMQQLRQSFETHKIKVKENEHPEITVDI